MTKIIVVIGFVITLAASVVVFMTMKQQSPVEQLMNTIDNEPRIVLDDFSVYWYKKEKIEATINAKLAHFLEPNLIELYANVNGFRLLKDNQTETLKCEAASVTLDADNLNDFFKQNKIDVNRANVEDNVQIGFNQNSLYTEFAEFIGRTHEIRSHEPVQVDGPNRSLKSETGFRYSLNREELEMRGVITGEVDPKGI